MDETARLNAKNSTYPGWPAGGRAHKNERIDRAPEI